MWSHGGDLLSVNKHNSAGTLIDFSANINPLGQPDSVKNAIKKSAKSSLNYPDPFCRELKSAICKLESVKEDKIVCGNGAAEIIYKIAYSLKAKSALIPAPTFSEYEQAVRQVNSVVNYVYLQQATGFALTIDLLKEIKNNDIIFLCNPNNPVGNIVDEALIVEILKECKKRNKTLVIDECFMDLSFNEVSAKKYLEKFEELIILKAFTKSFAIPGIRLGYALCGSAQIAQKLEKCGPPWSVSVPAQLAGVAACKEKEFIQKSVKYITEERNYLKKELKKLGIILYSSQTNYILIKVPDHNLREKLIEKGIVIRDCSNYVGLEKGYYRIAVRLHEENQQIIAALRGILCEKK